MGYDLDFQMTTYEAVLVSSAVPGSDQLKEIVRIGARAIRWAEVLQEDVAPEKREQIWRKIDGIGKETTFENPMIYNASLIEERFNKWLQTTPSQVTTILQGIDDLPHLLPSGIDLKSVMEIIREINKIYSRASRWLVLYDWKDSLPKSSRDYRGWLNLSKNYNQLDQDARTWDQLSQLQKATWVDKVFDACRIGVDTSLTCEGEKKNLTKLNESRTAIEWLNQAKLRGKSRFDTLFTVTVPHQGVKAELTGEKLNLTFYMFEVPSDILTWIVDQVHAGWNFQDSLEIGLSPVDEYRDGVVQVEWQTGALPHVNAVGGDVITMDANTPRWLEQTQVVMMHEFGHVIGFPDCYVEFWDDQVNGFVFYSLDPQNQMCALSGSLLESHRDAMRAAF